MKYHVTLTWERASVPTFPVNPIGKANLEIAVTADSMDEAIRKAIEASGYAEPEFRLLHASADRALVAEFLDAATSAP